MTELMIKMSSWLVASMALGFIVAWLLSRTIYKRKQDYVEDTFSAVILERNNMVEKLEKSFRNKRIMSEKLSKDLSHSEEALAEKTSLLTTLQNKLDNNSNEDISLALKEKNSLLRIQIEKLEQADRKRVKELAEFESVLLLAEERIEEREKNYREVLNKLDNDIENLTLENKNHKSAISSYEKTIAELKESLKLYESDSSNPEFIISKDQFVKIEEQLETYQEEIKLLKNKNSEFAAIERTLEDKTVDELEKERDDSSMVKVFRETYRKITKS